MKFTDFKDYFSYRCVIIIEIKFISTYQNDHTLLKNNRQEYSV
jgi:hypothetical protein